MALVTSAASSLKNTWGFSPQSIPGLALWLDAADTSSITGTSTVTAWRNKVTAGGSASTTSGTVSSTSATINGLPTVSFGTDAYMTAPSMTFAQTTRTVFIVVKIGASGVRRNFLMKTPAGSGTIDVLAFSYYNASPTYTDLELSYNGANLYQAQTQSPAIFNTTSIICMTTLSTNAGIFVNGTKQALNVTNQLAYGTGTTTSQTIGGVGGTASNPFDLGEAMIFDGNITDTQRQQVEGYLAAKWGLKANLPATHPYSATASVPFNRPFYPTDIGGCLLWLDAADQSSIVGTSPVTSWVDKSGTGNTMTITTGNVTYTTNPPAVVFPNAQVSCRSALSTNVITAGSSGFFMVLQNTAMNAASINMAFTCVNILEGGLYATSMRFQDASDPKKLRVSTTGDIGSNYYVNGTLGVPGGVGGNIITVPAGSNVIDTIFNLGGTTQFALSIGNYVDAALVNRFFIGNIQEVIVYTGPITTSQRQQVEQYLTWKWGLPTANLPTSHPGKLLPAFGTPFTPKSLTGLALWLDGADTTSMVRSGTTVSTWNDKSGNGGNATATGSPTSTGSGVVFPNTGIYFTLNTPYASTHTLFIVSTTSPASQVYLFGRNYPSGAPALILNYDVSKLEYYDDIRGRYTLAATPTSTFIASYIRTFGTSLALRYNGSQIGGLQASPTTSENTGLNWGYLGASSPGANMYNGTIYEFMIFNAALTTVQAQQVEGYLAWKWGLQRSLPSTHAYAKFSP